MRYNFLIRILGISMWDRSSQCARHGGSRIDSATWWRRGWRGGGSAAAMRPGIPLSRAVGDSGDVVVEEADGGQVVDSRCKCKL
jgi:hypothetical protein